MYHLGNWTSPSISNDFHDYESSVPVNGPATDEKSFAVNHARPLYQSSTLLIFKKIEKPIPSSTLNFFFFISIEIKVISNFRPIDNCIDNYRPDKFLNSKFSNLGIYPILIFIKLDIEREFKLLFQLVPISQMTWLNFDWNIFFIRVFPTCY